MLEVQLVVELLLLLVILEFEVIVSEFVLFKFKSLFVKLSTLSLRFRCSLANDWLGALELLELLGRVDAPGAGLVPGK